MCSLPALTAVNVPSGASAWPTYSSCESALLPQHWTVPSVRSPHVWSVPAVTALKDPSARVVCPK